MAIIYVGPTAAGLADGTSWSNRYGTLNAAEDRPIQAGDTVYVGPGVYREQLTCDVSGGAGNPITYIADVTGEHTDGVGGIVRITGSDNDLVSSAGRNYCIYGNNIDYRIFRGFALDSGRTADIYLYNGCDYWTLEDLTFTGHESPADYGIYVNEATPTGIIMRRCTAMFGGHSFAFFYHNVDTAAVACLIENCMTIAYRYGVECYNVSDVVIKNCLFAGLFGFAVYTVSLNPGDDIEVYNSLFVSCDRAFSAGALGEITEDFNNLAANNNDRVNVAAGVNSVNYLPLPLPPILHSGASQVSGYRFPWWFGELSEWCALRAITGFDQRTVDLRGLPRPATAVKNSWGPVQFHDAERDITTTHEASAASIVLNDAARHQMWVPCDATATTISVYVYREANYAGNLPQMIVKQPGQADTVVTDVGAAGGWNLLTTTLTPATLPQYVLVELVSRNTAAAGNYKTYFDDLVVA